MLVKDPVVTRDAYGPYVAPIRSDTNDARAMRSALRGAGSVVCLGKLGELPKARVPHAPVCLRTLVNT